jgi:hypothetical protein
MRGVWWTKRTRDRWRAGALLVVALGAAAVSCGRAVAEEAMPFWRVARVSGEVLGCLNGHAESEIELIACTPACAPIPWQLDERDEANELVLPEGPQANPESPSGVVDANDEILWMIADAGRRMRAEEVPAGAGCRREIPIRSARTTRWVYAFTVPPPAARSPVRYVEYDPGRDTVESARVAIGFGAPTPRFLSVRDADGRLGPNLLDRLKVRASARFLGLIPLGRDEDDIEWDFGAWHAGAIRVVRREWQWVRLGWGLRTPVFRTESFVYRDFIELPVRLRLNFPPTYFFRAIDVQAALDFRGLAGWTVHTPQGAAGVVGALSAGASSRLNALEADWLALEGPLTTLVLRLELGDSLASLRRQILYRDTDEARGPEALAGEHPAIGFRLTEWGAVDRGNHHFTAVSCALPATYDLAEFASQDVEPISVAVTPFGDAAPE